MSCVSAEGVPAELVREGNQPVSGSESDLQRTLMYQLSCLSANIQQKNYWIPWRWTSGQPLCNPVMEERVYVSVFPLRLWSDQQVAVTHACSRMQTLSCINTNNGWRVLQRCLQRLQLRPAQDASSFTRFSLVGKTRGGEQKSTNVHKPAA